MPIPGTNNTKAALGDAGTDITQPGSAEVIVMYIIITILMIMSIVVAKKMGALGADQATKLSGAITIGGTAWMARQTGGRLAYNMEQGRTGTALREAAARGGAGGWAARQSLKTLDYSKKASFDLRASDKFQKGMAAATGYAGTKIDMGKPGVKKGYEGFAGMRRKEKEDAATVVKQAGEQTLYEKQQLKKLEGSDSVQQYLSIDKSITSTKEKIKNLDNKIKNEKNSNTKAKLEEQKNKLVKNELVNLQKQKADLEQKDLTVKTYKRTKEASEKRKKVTADSFATGSRGFTPSSFLKRSTQRDQYRLEKIDNNIEITERKIGEKEAEIANTTNEAKKLYLEGRLKAMKLQLAVYNSYKPTLQNKLKRREAARKFEILGLKPFDYSQSDPSKKDIELAEHLKEQLKDKDKGDQILDMLNKMQQDKESDGDLSTPSSSSGTPNS
jgi:hypothetical protein